MTKRSFMGIIMVGLTLFLGATFLAASDAAGSLTGTWNCLAKGTSQGDTPFTLNLEQNGTTIEGSVSTGEGGTRITSGTFRDGVLEIHIDTSDANYVLKADYAKGVLTGTWSKESESHGTWEGKKQASSSK